MINMMIMSIFMGLICVIFMVAGVIMMYFDLKIMFEWKAASVNSINMEFMLLFDWISLLFVGVILLISSMVLSYSLIYMSEEKNLNRFCWLMILFIFSMILMVLSPNMMSILVGWDSLGMVSYCLVMYYQNFLSYNSGMVTVLTNRLGDVGILMSISFMMMSGSWSVEMVSKKSVMVMIMLLLAAVTKSAQVPFSVWLPMAMAAPTPVSALVHSSTLVTAGIYLMIRFHDILLESGVKNILCFISVVTMIMAGFMASLENDFKKIIALSTLSQLGFMMMILSMGFKFIAFYHLLIHAIFKSMLFMSAGVVIHFMKNEQDIRLLGNLNEVMPFVMMSLMISSSALMGVPFMSGFYSKDWIMELIYTSSVSNLLMLMMVVISLFMTVVYTIRFLYYLLFNMEMKFYSYSYFSEMNVMNLSMMILMVFSIILGSMMNWMFFFDYYVVYLNLSAKLFTLIVCLSVSGVSLIILILVKKFMKFYYLNYYFSSMWFLMSVYGWIYKPVNILGECMFDLDKSWVEWVEKHYLFNFMVSQWKEVSHKFYMFMSMMMIMGVYVCLW